MNEYFLITQKPEEWVEQIDTIIKKCPTFGVLLYNELSSSISGIVNLNNMELLKLLKAMAYCSIKFIDINPVKLSILLIERFGVMKNYKVQVFNYVNWVSGMEAYLLFIIRGIFIKGLQTWDEVLKYCDTKYELFITGDFNSPRSNSPRKVRFCFNNL